jgi:hypothetical protein
MQKAQLLSQPTWMVTHPDQSTSRRAGSADGKLSSSVSTMASQISTTGPVASASWSSSTARCTLWVPNTTSTWGARWRTASRSIWARHPDTMIRRSGRSSLSGLRAPRVPYSLLSAFSRMQQVFSTTTSASSRLSVGSMPSASSNPAMRSESCSFIWHPKVRTRYRRVTVSGYADATHRRHPDVTTGRASGVAGGVAAPDRRKPCARAATAGGRQAAAAARSARAVEAGGRAGPGREISRRRRWVRRRVR